MKNRQCLILRILVAMVASTGAHAADLRELRAERLGATPIDQLAMKLGLGADYSFVEHGSYQTARGTTMARMQQRYQGIPVYGRSIAVERDAAGNALVAHGGLLQNVQADVRSVKPRLSAAKALSALRAATGLAPVSEPSLNDEQAELYVYLDGSSRARLAYLVSYVAGGSELSEPTAVVDANSGEVVARWDGMDRFEAKAGNERKAYATGPGGNAKTGKYRYGADYPKLIVRQSGNTCSLKNARVKVYDYNDTRKNGFTEVKKFPCPISDEPEVNGAYAPINDAYYFTGLVSDMYKAWFGERPLKYSPDDKAIKVIVHAPAKYAGALREWILISDGDKDHYPATVLDMVAHEIGHRVAKFHSGLNIPGEPAAIGEAYADMTAVAAKFFARNGQSDFLIGSDLSKSKAGWIRDMCDPTRDGKSIDHAANYRDVGVGQHEAAGVYNKAFCLLAKTDGWDVRKAFEVFHGANIAYWDSYFGFDEAACGVESAADDKGYPRSDVTAAFERVGVRCAPIPKVAEQRSADET